MSLSANSLNNAQLSTNWHSTASSSPPSLRALDSMDWFSESSLAYSHPISTDSMPANDAPLSIDDAVSRIHSALLS